ncbi:hypothetical protein SMICM304S_11039 [Streptomyces microflavus]
MGRVLHPDHVHLVLVVTPLAAHGLIDVDESHRQPQGVDDHETPARSRGEAGAVAVLVLERPASVCDEDVKRRSRRLFVTTKMLDSTMAAAAIIGLRTPDAARGMPARL